MILEFKEENAAQVLKKGFGTTTGTSIRSFEDLFLFFLRGEELFWAVLLFCYVYFFIIYIAYLDIPTQLTSSFLAWHVYFVPAYIDVVDTTQGFPVVYSIIFLYLWSFITSQFVAYLLVSWSGLPPRFISHISPGKLLSTATSLASQRE